jgi:tripartite-type tricarboxylate transporter receptor subunit TctC
MAPAEGLGGTARVSQLDENGVHCFVGGGVDSRQQLKGDIMKLSRLQFLRLAAGAAALPAVSRIARAQSYPTRPVRWIVSFAAGGSNDIVARVLGQVLSEKLGQQFIIEDKAGAGGNIGMAAVLSSLPDGYTIGFATPNNAINASLYEKLPFDFIRDSEPVGGTMLLTNVLEVHPSVPAETVAEFIAYVKANPGKVSFASSGTGTSLHMSGELFKAMTGIDMLHVPYRGGGPALNDLLPGRVQVMFDNLPSSIEHIRAGSLRALGVTAGKRSDALPNVPTIGETVSGYDVNVWNGIVAPRRTPPEVIATLNRALNAALADPRLKARFAELGGTPMPMTPADFGKLIADETEKWAKVVRFAGIKPD